MSVTFAQMFPGMEWIPAMLCFTGVGLVLGVLGTLVGMAVSNSRFAFRAGLAACLIGSGSVVFFLLVAGRYLNPAAYLFLGIPMFAGLPAILLSYRQPARWVGEAGNPAAAASPTEQERVKPRSWVANPAVRVLFVLTCAALLLVGGCVHWLRPRRAFDRLLAGDRQVEVTSLLITGQGQRVMLDDPESARYLTDAFRSPQPNPTSFGITYTGEVGLSSGGSVEVALYLPDEGDGVAMSWPLDSLGDPTYYWLRLPEPMPPTLADALKRLR